MFVQAAVEDLPCELDGLTGEVYVNFPWGSLLQGIASGDETVLRNLRRLCLPDAQLKITIGLDPQRDRSELERLKLPAITPGFISSVLESKYRNVGFEIVDSYELGWANGPETQTSWARKLKQSPDRLLVRIVARAL